MRFKFLFAGILAILVISCTKNNEIQPEIEDSDISYASAFKEFSKILSEAVFSDEAIRCFIKEEALKQFDNDYDVFYPKVKYSYLKGGKTFREHLLEFTTEETLSQIERAIPKLTILVPDWDWLSSFSAKTWDTSDNKVYVGYEQEGNKKSVFLDGIIAFELDNGEVLGSPTIIVKDNERIKYVAPATKGEEPRFEFVSPVFEGDLLRGRKWTETTIDFKYEMLDDFVPEIDIYPELISAYNEFKTYPLESACQRDYVYYGMNHINTNEGIRKGHICERFYRFRVTPNAYRTMSDQYNLGTTQNDPKLHDEEVKHNKSHYQKFEQDLKNKIWSDGSFEFRFSFYIVGEQGETIGPSMTFPWSVPASQLYDLKCVHKKYKKQTAVATGEYIYRFEPEDLIPKWVYLENIKLPSWDISNSANSLIVNVDEWDVGEELVETESTTCKFSHNFSWKGDVSADSTYKGVNIKTSFGIAGGNSSETTKIYTMTIKRTTGSDNLGTGMVSYDDKIIDSPATKMINGEKVSGYNVQSTQIGNVFITLLPVDRSR